MRLDRYFSRKRVLELESDNLEGCLKELLKASAESFKDLSRKKNLLPGLLRRENTMTTYLGHGVALPHLRVKMNRRYVFAIGRSKEGIKYDGPKKEEKVHLILLMLAGEQHPALRTWVQVDERCAAFFALGMARATQTPVAVIGTSGSAASC